MPGSETGYNPDRIIRLIYYDYIVSNFQDMYPSAPITKAIEANFKGPDI